MITSTTAIAVEDRNEQDDDILTCLIQLALALAALMYISTLLVDCDVLCAAMIYARFRTTVDALNAETLFIAQVGLLHLYGALRVRRRSGWVSGLTPRRRPS